MTWSIHCQTTPWRYTTFTKHRELLLLTLESYALAELIITIQSSWHGSFIFSGRFLVSITELTHSLETFKYWRLVETFNKLDRRLVSLRMQLTWVERVGETHVFSSLNHPTYHSQEANKIPCTTHNYACAALRRWYINCQELMSWGVKLHTSFDIIYVLRLYTLRVPFSVVNPHTTLKTTLTK